MDLTSALLTGLGLAGAAGLNAYVPLLVVGLLARGGVIELPSSTQSLTSTPVLVALALLLAVEVLADKIPGVDSVNDVVQTVIRPLAGAVLFAGSLGLIGEVPPWVGIVAGVTTAGGVHLTKAAVRPAVNVSTGGLGGPVVSVLEDVVSLVASVLAVLAPFVLAGVVLVAALLARRWWTRRRARVAA